MAPVRWVMTNVVVRQAAASFTYPLSTFASLHPCPPESGGRIHSKTPASPHSRNGSAGRSALKHGGAGSTIGDRQRIVAGAHEHDHPTASRTVRDVDSVVARTGVDQDIATHGVCVVVKHVVAGAEDREQVVADIHVGDG